MLIFIGLILFQIGMYIFVRSANADPNFNNIGSYSGDTDVNIDASTDQDISFTEASSWYDGFKISGLGLPWWADVFYGGFVALLFGISIYALIRGLG